MAERKHFADRRDIEDTITIPISTTTTGVIDSIHMNLVGVDLPAAFDGTALTFQSSPTRNGTFQDLYNDEGEQFKAKSIQPGRNIRWDIIDFNADRFVKIVSNATETAERTLVLKFVPK